MNKSLKVALAIIAAAGISAAGYYYFLRGNNQAHLRYVPKNSGMVMAISVKSLFSKVDYPELRKMKMYQQVMRNIQQDADLELVSQIIHSPAESGIDFDANAYAFGSFENRLASNSGGVVIALRNKEDFEKLVRKSNTESGIKSGNGFNYAEITQESLLGWNEKAAILLLNVQNPDGVKKLEELMKQDKKNCITADDRFQQFLKEKCDMGIWLNYASIMALMPETVQLQLLSQSDLDKASLHFFMSFDQNDVGVKMNLAYEKSAKVAPIDVFKGEGVSENHLKMISQDKVYAMMSASLEMDNLFEVLNKDKDMRMTIDELAKKFGLNKDALVNLISGDISIAVVDFDEYKIQANGSSANRLGRGNRGFMTVQYDEDEMDGEEDYDAFDDLPLETPYAMQKPKLPGMVLSISAKEPAAIEGIFKKLGLPNQHGIYWVSFGFLNGYAAVTPNGVAITTNEDLAIALLNKKEFKIPAGDFKQVVTKNPFAMWVDLNVSHYPEEIVEHITRQTGEANFMSFKDAMRNFKSLEITGSSKLGELKINMIEDKSNSLMRLLQMTEEFEN